jgi:hypothetical protein
MAEHGIDPALRQEIKRAVAEALREQRDMLQEVFLEVLEEIGLREAIREGRASEEVARERIFELLEGGG